MRLYRPLTFPISGGYGYGYGYQPYGYRGVYVSIFNLLSGAQHLTLIVITGAWAAWVWASVLVSSADLSWVLRCSKSGKGIIDESGKRLGGLAVDLYLKDKTRGVGFYPEVKCVL